MFHIAFHVNSYLNPKLSTTYLYYFFYIYAYCWLLQHIHFFLSIVSSWLWSDAGKKKSDHKDIPIGLISCLHSDNLVSLQSPEVFFFSSWPLASVWICCQKASWKVKLEFTFTHTIILGTRILLFRTGLSAGPGLEQQITVVPRMAFAQLCIVHQLCLFLDQDVLLSHWYLNYLPIGLLQYVHEAILEYLKASAGAKCSCGGSHGCQLLSTCNTSVPWATLVTSMLLGEILVAAFKVLHGGGWVMCRPFLLKRYLPILLDLPGKACLGSCLLRVTSGKT